MTYLEYCRQIKSSGRNIFQGYDLQIETIFEIVWSYSYMKEVTKVSESYEPDGHIINQSKSKLEKLWKKGQSYQCHLYNLNGFM